MRIVIAGATGTVGRHVTVEARRRGHDVVLLTRSSGHDLMAGAGAGRGAGLGGVLDGADAVIDVTSASAIATERSRTFFTTVTRALQAAEVAVGVPHHVALSIVGIDGIDTGYYAGKLAQERLIAADAVPWSVLRATQFHEFAERIARASSVGPLVLAPTAPLRPVAAREAATALVDLAEGPPAGRVADLRGPRNEELPAMIRRMLAADGARRLVLPTSLPGAYWAGLRSGALRGTDSARSGVVTFDEWLGGTDHTRTA